MDVLIHYIKSGRSFGPVSVQDFLDLFDRGVIELRDLARVEGETGWVAVADLVVQAKNGQLARPTRAASRRPGTSAPPGGHTVFTSAPPIPKQRVPAPAEATAAGPSAHAQRCPKCHASSGVEARFCKLCGTGLRPRRCGGCNANNDGDALFCVGCGQRLGSLAPPPARDS